MHTDPKSSVDILEHVTGGVQVQAFDSFPTGRRSRDSIVAVVQTDAETHSVGSAPQHARPEGVDSRHADSRKPR